MFMHNCFLCCISNKSNFVYVLVHGNILMCYSCIPFIYVDVHFVKRLEGFVTNLAEWSCSQVQKEIIE